MSSHIEYQRFRRGETCTEEGCRARKFYIEDGKKFCQRGHEQLGFTQTQQDDDDWNAQGKKSRKQREEKERIETVLSGNEARELYLQCYQLILWKQCHWLVNVKGFPPALETVVRDLWDLRTRNLRMREERSGYGSSITGTMMFSSQSEGETDHDTDATGARSMASRRSRKSIVSEDKLPRLVEMLGLCYLGVLLLRLPTSLGELFKWAMHGELIYTRAITEIPKEMRTKLPPHFHSALEINAPMKEMTLHRSILELVEFFHLQVEMIFPPLNVSLLLLKHVRDLALPVEVMPAVRRLADLLDIDFSYPLRNAKSYNVAAYPEIQLISLIAIATKLSQPFDNVSRLPVSESDFTTMKINWKAWAMTMADKGGDQLKRGEELRVKDTDVWNMDQGGMDDYLDWYQRTWIDDKDLKMPAQILELFPLAPIGPRPAIPEDTVAPLLKLQSVHEALIVQKHWPETKEREREHIRRPGDLYKRYRKAEELPETAKAFYGLAASNAGISLEMLVKGVFLLEVQLENWMTREKKKQAAKATQPEQDDDEDW